MFEEAQNYCKNITTSLAMNYKSWIAIFISLFLINGFKYNGKSFLTFFIGMIFAHIIHYMLHFKYIYPHNIVHSYHHGHNNSFSHYSQMILEIVSFLGILFMKYFAYEFTCLFYLIDDWTVILFYFFYTTIHVVNYGYFHVNHVHEIHHRVFYQNMGPDICDIIMGTKYHPEKGLENTDHYISNCIYCTIIVLLLQFIWKKSGTETRNLYLFLSNSLFLGCVLFLVISTIVLYIKDIDEVFDKQILKIKKKLDMCGGDKGFP